MFEIGWYSGYRQACNEWKHTLRDIKGEVETLCIPIMGDSRYAECIKDVLQIIDKYMEE